MFAAGLSLALTYDRFEFVAPGFETRYQLFHGVPAQDPFMGAATGAITNHVLMSGVTLKFKL